MFMLLSGCINQNNQYSGNQNFDQLKAAKNRVSLGLTYLKNGNFSQAKFNLDKAMDFAPRSADVNFAMAYYYQNVDELEKAEKAYQFAMDLEPKNANIANSYGAFLCQNGNYEKAKKYFLKAVNTSSYISSAETYENLALCSQSQGHSDDAVEYLRNAVSHQPGRANSLFLLAKALLDTEQWEEARDVLRRYEKVSKISPYSLSMAIQIERETGNYQVAKGYTDMLVKIFPNDPVTKAVLENKSPFISSSKPLARKTKKISKIDKTNNSIKVQVPKQTKVVTIESPIKQEAPKNSKNIETELTEVEVPDFHVVAKGENLYRISLLYNIKMQRLIEWNGLADASAIFNGKKLSLVAPNAVDE